MPADSPEFLAVARGDRPADLLLRGGRIVNVCSGEVHEADVAVFGGRIAGLGTGYDAAEVVDLEGAYLAPAFIEGHIHVESTLLAPFELARVVCARGTGALVSDPHEIANVLGVPGVQWMLDASEGAPADVLVMASSCVPATDMETAGARLDADAIADLLTRERVIGLAEVMDFPGVVAGAPGLMAKLRAAAGRPIDGHAPGLSGRALCAYVAAGPGSDHETTTVEEAREKLRLGMRVMLRDGTPARDLETLLPVVTPANARRCLMVSDDIDPADLLDRGHLDHHLRTAVRAGLDPVTALRMVTLNAAEWFGLHDRGAIVPGARADLVALGDLSEFPALRVWHGGALVAEDGRCLVDFAAPPEGAGDTVRVDWERVDLGLRARAGAHARVIGVIPGSILTEALTEEPPRAGGAAAAEADGGGDAVVADAERGLAHLAVVERHTGASGTAGCLVRGLGLRRGAIASTVAHDHHNLLIAGIDEADMLVAGREAARLGGGWVAAAGGEVLAALALPVAGLMSRAPVEDVRADLDAVLAAARSLGSELDNPYMTLSFLGLEVIPKLKLTDRGLVDVERFELVDPFPA